jgi:quercetin dioxygenase-like cupin family protein
MGESDPGGEHQAGLIRAETHRQWMSWEVEVNDSADAPSKKTNYSVKNVELVLAGADVQARVLTLAAGDSIPWHYHSETVDHYFVLRGSLTIATRNPDQEHELRPGDRHRVTPGTAHQISNQGAAESQFLLLQGVGKYDWIKADA